jgi:hypothetical protein
MGGVGMTTACLVVVSDQEAASAYPETRIWISLGTDVTAEAVVDQLAGIVEKTVVALTAKLMRDMFKEHGTVKLDSIKDNARQWFHDRHVLLVLDNMFPSSNESSSRHLVQFLKHVLGCDSYLLFSTRAVELTVESDVVITFQPFEILQQQKGMLFAHLGVTGAALEPSQVSKLLDFSRRLPMALATASPLARC